MFDIGWSELLIIAVVLIVVVGPKDLPPMLRAFGKMTQRAKRVASDFRAQFDEALREADMDDLRQTLTDAQKLSPAHTLREAMNPLRQMGNDIKADLQKATRTDAPDQINEDLKTTPLTAISSEAVSSEPAETAPLTTSSAPSEAVATPSSMSAPASSTPQTGAIQAAPATSAPAALAPAPKAKAVRKTKPAIAESNEAPLAVKPKRAPAKVAIGESAVAQLADKPKRTRTTRAPVEKTVAEAPAKARKPRTVKLDASNKTAEKKDEA